MTQRERYPIPARLNLGLTAAQVLGSVALLVLASRTTSTPAFVACVLGFALVMQTGFSLLHEAEHNKLHPNRTVNDVCGLLLAALFPGSYQFMKSAHLAHHRRNRSDAELVDYVRPGESRAVKWTQYYALICGLIWLGVPLLSVAISLVPWRLVPKSANERQGGAMSYLGMIRDAGPMRVRLETLFTVALWLGLSQVLSLGAVAACYAAFAFSWASQQYVYHIRTPRHLVEGAFDLELWRPLELLYLCFNYHLQHHRAPGVPWIHTPKLALEAPRRGYWQTYAALWQPPEPVDQAFPRELQTH